MPLNPALSPAFTLHVGKYTHTHTHTNTHTLAWPVSHISPLPCLAYHAKFLMQLSGIVAEPPASTYQIQYMACLSSLHTRVNGNTFWNVPTTATNCLPIPPAIFLRSPSSHPLSLRQGSTKIHHPHPNQGSIARDDQCKLAWDHREIGESLDSTICSLNCGKSIPSKLFASESNTCSLQQKHVSGNDTA